MPIFTFRPLVGFYKGSSANQLSDYTKINNSFLELSKDIPNLDTRLKVLEANAVGILSTGNFVTNSIMGTVLQDNTVSGSKMQDGSITGDKIILNSVHGIIDANISSAANISASKINVGQISHASIKDIGTNTHPQIDTALSQLFHDVGSTVGSPLAQPLDPRVTANATQVVALQGSLSSLNTFVNPQQLGTVSQQVTGAINELVQDLQQVGASGLGIAGPASSTINAVALWDSTNGRVLKNSAIIHDSGNLITTFPGNLELLNAGSNLATAAIPFHTINTIAMRMQAGVDGGFIFSSGIGLSLQPGDAFTTTSFVSSNATDTINTSGLVMAVAHPIYTDTLKSRPGDSLAITSNSNISLNAPSNITIDGGSGVNIISSGTPISISALGANGQSSGGNINIATSGAALIITTGIATHTVNDTELQWVNGTDTLTVNHSELFYDNGTAFYIANNSELSWNNGPDTFEVSHVELFWNNSTTTFQVNDTEVIWTNATTVLQIDDSQFSWVNGPAALIVNNVHGNIVVPSGSLQLHASTNIAIDGAVVFTTVLIADIPGGGDIGTAANTVDKASSFNITQTTAGQTLTIPSPGVAAAGKIAYINNTGSTSFTMFAKVVPAGAGLTAMWTGSAWSLIGFGG